MKKKKGYTLIELIVVLALFAIVSIMILSFITMANKFNTKAKNREIINQSQKTTVVKLNDELRTATTIIVKDTTTTADTIDVSAINGEAYTIKLDSNHQLCKYDSTGIVQEVLGENITKISFKVDGKLCTIEGKVESGAFQNDFKTTVVII